MIRPFLRSPSPLIKVHAAGMMAAWGYPKEGIPLLPPLLKHPKREVYFPAFEYLRLSNKYASSVLPQIIAIFNKMKDIEKASYVAQLIGIYGEKSAAATPQLVAFFRKGGELRRSFRFALTSIGPKAKSALPVLCRAYFCFPSSKKWQHSRFGRGIRSISLGKTCEALFPKMSKVAPLRCKCKVLVKDCHRWDAKASVCRSLCLGGKVCQRNRCVSKTSLKKPKGMSRKAPPRFSPHWTGVDVHFGEKQTMLRLMGVYFDKPQGYQRGDTIKMRLLFKSVRKVKDNWKIFVHAEPTRWTRNRIQILRHPYTGNYPTSLWKPGEFFTVELSKKIPPHYRSRYNGLTVYLGWTFGGKRIPIRKTSTTKNNWGHRAKILRLKLVL